MPLKFLIGRICRKFRKSWCLLKNSIAVISKNHWVDIVCLNFLYLGSFCFCTTEFRFLLNWICSEASSPHILEALFETYIFSLCFWYFWQVKALFILNLFISEHIDKVLHGRRWRRHFEKSSIPMFLLTIQIKTQTTQTIKIMKSVSTFIRLFKSIPEVRKICIVQWFWKYFFIISYWEESEQSEV